MKKGVSNFLVFLLALVCFIGAQLIRKSVDEDDSPPSRPEEMDTILADQIQRSIADTQSTDPSRPAFSLPENATAFSLSTNTTISESDISSLPRNAPELKEDKGYLFLDSAKRQFVGSKLGLDFKHHFQNCFLVGYRPFEVSDIWMPHRVLTMRLKYQLDWDQFPGFQEIWLTSYQAFQTGRGDCEDHSIALADWLIDMGEDARVVTGTHEGGGHAWVVVIRDTGTFLLEATSKRKRRLWSSYPIAKLAKGYQPQAMFNRDFYWTNEDPSRFGDYTGDHWIKSGQVTY
ncbi:hypothetical protein VDG1235_341 [Verrucomicrobiia bacterium DG1235]|nr:hypothetical protein VDG1235_341 [Verrucomicrobiae bacterium DG1235]